MIERIIKDYKPFIEGMGHGYAYRTDIEHEDAVQAAYEGFVRAWRDWDPERGTLKTWSHSFIRESLRRCWEESQRGPYVPSQTLRDNEAGRTTAETSRAIQAARQPVLSLDAPLFEDPNTGEVFTLGDTLSLVNNQPTIITDGRIDALLDQLSPREREVIEMTYGLNGHPPMNAREAGEQLGISPSTVRWTHRSGTQRLVHNV